MNNKSIAPNSVFGKQDLESLNQKIHDIASDLAASQKRINAEMDRIIEREYFVISGLVEFYASRVGISRQEVLVASEWKTTRPTTMEESKRMIGRELWHDRCCVVRVAFLLSEDGNSVKVGIWDYLGRMVNHGSQSQI